MKELILIEGLSKDELFTAIQAVVKDLLFFENETVTSLKVMEGDRANQYVIRPNRLCGGWDFHMLCDSFKSELSSHKGVVAKAWFQLPDDESMSILPRGKYFYDLSDSSTDEIFAVAPSGTRYGFVEIDDEGGAELMEIEPQGRSTYEPRPMLQLRPMADGFFEVEKLTFWQRIKKRYAGLMGSHSSLGVGLWSILFIVVFFAFLCVAIIGWWDFSETVLPFTLPMWVVLLVLGVVGAVVGLALLKKYFDGWWGPVFFGIMSAAIGLGLLMTAVFSVNVWLGSDEQEVGRGVVREHYLAGRRKDVNQYSVWVEEPVKGYIYIATGDDGSFGSGDTVAVPMTKGLFGMYHAETLKPLD
ncbi:MAG: hypothetical protein IKC19_08370 [Bacteroidales bacterium]|nr:hypothetical protein [Bacteroidales bacterium]